MARYAVKPGNLKSTLTPWDHASRGLYVTDADHAMIIDCGCDPKELLKYVEENKITVDYVVLTHGHYDHIDFIGDYAQSFKNAEIICHREELPLISDPEGNLSCFFGFSKKYEENYCSAAGSGHDDEPGCLRRKGSC